MPATLTDSQKICFQRGLAAGAVSAKGFSDVALITGETEALGHGIYVDEASIEGLMGLLMGKSLPGYLTHEGAIFSDRLGKEIGFFSGFYRDGMKLKAQNFTFLNAFIKHDAEDYEKLVELAEKMPDQFGLSVVFSGRAVWVMEDGSEVDASEPMPEGALRGKPSVRFGSIESADFVKAPAANPDGLYSKRVDDAGKGMATETTSANTQTITLSVDHLSAKVEELTGALAAKETEYTAALAKINEQLAAKDSEISTLKASLAAKDAAIEQADKRATEAVAERDEAVKYDIRKAGVRAEDLPDTNANVTDEKKPETQDEKWAHYGKLHESDPVAAQKFYDENLRVFRR